MATTIQTVSGKEIPVNEAAADVETAVTDALGKAAFVHLQTPDGPVSIAPSAIQAIIES